MEGQREASDAMLSNTGWLVSAALAVWGWILKLSLGRHLDATDRLEKKVDDLLERVSRMEGHLDGKRK